MNRDLSRFHPIVDSHTHVDEVAALGWIDPPEKIISLIDEAGIDRAVIMTYTELPGFNPGALEYIAEAVARYADRLIGYARLHPWHEQEAAQLLRKAVREYRMKGLKLHPVGTLAHPGDPSTVRLMRVAAELQVPVLFHCGDEPMTTPLAIVEAARRVPEATVILGHMGGYFHVDEAIEVAERFPGVLLETSAMPYPRKIREAVERLGPQRVLFASDGPGCPPRLELQKVLQAGLSETELRLVLGGNILRLHERVLH